MAATDARLGGDAEPKVSLLYNPALRSYAYQAITVIVILWAVWYAWTNAAANLARANMTAGFGFLNSRALGPQYEGDLFVGFSVPEPLGGPLFHFNLTGNRRKIAVDDPRLEDRVADNLTFHDMTESESLLIGRDFGVVTDIETAPNGNVIVVSIDQGAIYEIFNPRKRGRN